MTAWADNAAIVVALTGYVEVFVNTDHTIFWSIVIATTGLWIPVLINVVGIRTMGASQAIFTILKIVPLVFIAIVGVFFIDPANFGAFNSSGGSAWGAIAGAGAIALFAYLGIETASVATGRVKNPEQNVGRAPVWGTVVCAVIYILGTFVVFGTVSNTALRLSTAPFSDAANSIFGGSLAGRSVAVAAIVSGLGCLVGWTFIVGEMPNAAAKDGMSPKIFAREQRGLPIFGILASTILATLLTVVAYTKFSQVFTTVLLLTVFTSVIPYMFSAAAQVFWLVTKGRPTSWGHFVKDLTISLVALAFIFWALAGAGAQAAYYGVFVFLLGVPLYVWLRASKKVPAVPASAGISAEADVVTATQLETHVQKHPELEPIT